jgi:hypothetical protein
MHRLDDAGLDENWIGDEKETADAETDSDFAELSSGVTAEDQFAGRVESPGGAHVRLP